MYSAPSYKKVVILDAHLKCAGGVHRQVFLLLAFEEVVDVVLTPQWQVGTGNQMCPIILLTIVHHFLEEREFGDCLRIIAPSHIQTLN